MDSNSQQEKCKRIFAQRLAEECQARHWPQDQWQKRLKEITRASQATVSRWLSGESIPHPNMRQALSREFDKLDSYWLGGKTDIGIQMDAEAGAMELKEQPHETSLHEPPAPGSDVSKPRLADLRVFAAPELKRMIKHLSERLMDAPTPKAAHLLEQIEIISATLRAKLREAPEPRSGKEVVRVQV